MANQIQNFPLFRAIERNLLDCGRTFYTIAKKVNSFVNTLTFPIYFFWINFSRFRPIYFLTLPARYLAERVIDLSDKIWQVAESRYEPHEVIFSNEEVERFKEHYFGLGDRSWKEGIDLEYHHHGRRVFDEGWHGGTIEPGFARSFERAKNMIGRSLGEKVTPDLYLRTHSYLTAHFVGESNGALMGFHRCGAFRGTESSIRNGKRNLSSIPQEARDELAALDPPPSRFSVYEGEMYGHYINCMEQDEVRSFMERYLRDFYTEISSASTNDEKFEAIGRLHVRLEFLHPPRDGSTRTNVMIINLLLTQYLGHPALFDDPNDPPWMGTANWIPKLKEAWQRWEDERNSLS